MHPGKPVLARQGSAPDLPHGDIIVPVISLLYLALPLVQNRLPCNKTPRIGMFDAGRFFWQKILQFAGQLAVTQDA